MRLIIPAGGFQSAVFSRERNDRRLQFLNGRSQIHRTAQDDFTQQIILPAKKGEDARLWRVFLLQAADLGNDFLLPPPGANLPASGYAGPDPVVDGRGQKGNILVVHGASARQLIVKAGDFISVDDTLNMAVADATSDAGGTCTLTLLRVIGRELQSGERVTVRNPKGLYTLQEPKAGYSIDYALRFGFSFQAREKKK